MARGNEFLDIEEPSTKGESLGLGGVRKSLKRATIPKWNFDLSDEEGQIEVATNNKNWLDAIDAIDVSPKAEAAEFDEVTGGETVDLSPNAERNERIKTSEPSVSNLKSFIIQYEGFRAKAYNDVDRLSIGYGSKATSKDQVISKEEAEKMLEADIKVARKSVLNAEKKYKYNFNDAQRDALASFVYNAGGDNLLKLLDNGNRGLEEISNSFRLYNKGGGKVLPGLVKRRKAESDLFSMGYPTGEE